MSEHLSAIVGAGVGVGVGDERKFFKCCMGLELEVLVLRHVLVVMVAGWGTEELIEVTVDGSAVRGGYMTYQFLGWWFILYHCMV